MILAQLSRGVRHQAFLCHRVYHHPPAAEQTLSEGVMRQLQLVQAPLLLRTPTVLLLDPHRLLAKGPLIPGLPCLHVGEAPVKHIKPSALGHNLLWP